jgi:hypothetical protein
MTYGLAHQETSAVLILEDPRAIESKARRADMGRLDSNMNMNGERDTESPNDAKENIFKRRKVVANGPWYIFSVALLIEGSDFFASMLEFEELEKEKYGVDVKCRCRVRRFRWEAIGRYLEVKIS